MVNSEETPLHPTAQKLVDTVIEMLQTTSYNNIKSENVLLRSGITRGPLYHHFADFDDLIETAQIQLYKSFVLEVISQLLKVIEATDDLEGARTELHAFVEARTVKISDVAILMQSTFIGRVLDGMSNVQMNPREWVKVLNTLFDRFFFIGATPTQ
jgi:AcrR family transcriptional regulator